MNGFFVAYNCHPETKDHTSNSLKLVIARNEAISFAKSIIDQCGCFVPRDDT